MCRKRLSLKPCMNYECPHNLFWKGLNLNPETFKITNKALEIGNCCCLINEPWTAEEIREVWGLTIENIIQHERIAWGKIHNKMARDNQIERFASLN